jgi:hypothetical protein
MKATAPRSMPRWGWAAVGAAGLIALAGLVHSGGPGASSRAAAALSGGWRLTVYYTAVERFHGGAPQAVFGCPVLACENGSDYLGTFPHDFVQAVMDEGTGRITSGEHAGAYLNWSIGVGYWLDADPRDARGQPLVPYVSAAADPGVPFGTPLRVLDCGVDDTTGSAEDVDPAFCDRLKAAEWVVRDRFTAGTVGRHLDLYIGLEDRPDFVDTSSKVISTERATVELLDPPPAASR